MKGLRAAGAGRLVHLAAVQAAITSARLRVLAIAGVGVWSVGWCFETHRRAPARVRRDPANRGTVLDLGLSRYTRHPNYFGDAAVWPGSG